MIYSIPGFHEPVSSWSHLLTALVFAILSFPLLARARRGRVFLAIYCVSIVSLFAISGTYHLLGPSTGRSVMLRIDLSAIFLLIVGTMTPVHGLLFRGWGRWLPLAFLWAAAATLIPLLCVFYPTIPRPVWIAVQLGLGWFGALVGGYLGYRDGWRTVKPLAIGGLYYTIGALVNAYSWPIAIAHIIGPHELFHLAVVTAAAYHWHFIYQAACEAEPRFPHKADSP